MTDDKDWLTNEWIEQSLAAPGPSDYLARIATAVEQQYGEPVGVRYVPPDPFNAQWKPNGWAQTCIAIDFPNPESTNERDRFFTVHSNFDSHDFPDPEELARQMIKSHRQEIGLLPHD